MGMYAPNWSIPSGEYLDPSSFVERYAVVFLRGVPSIHTFRLDWRKPSHPSSTPEYATYVKILTCFLDTPSPMAPFSIHRFALAAKELGEDVGSWFGPTTAAGAIKFVPSLLMRWYNILKRSL